jgi:hypothetical protein
VDLRFHALEQTARLGAQPIDAVGDGARLRHDCAARVGQLRVRVDCRSNTESPSCASRLAIV